VAVVADRHAHAPHGGVVDERVGVALRVVVLFVEARVLGDVHHPRHPEQRAVRVEDGGAVVAPSIGPEFVLVEHRNEAEFGGARGDAVAGGTGDRLRNLRGAGVVGPLREEAVDREFGERH